MNYKTIIFDLDGTLLNTVEDLANSVNFSLNDAHYPLRTIEEIQSFIGNGVKKLIMRSVPLGTGDKEIEERLTVFRSHYLNHMQDNTKVYNGILDLLLNLKNKGYQMAIVSNKLDSAVKELNKIFFDSLIDIAIGTPPEAKKPDPTSVIFVMKQLNSDITNTIYVGDTEVDIETAHNAKIPCVCATWGYRDYEFLVNHGADYVIHKPEELLYILKRRY